MILIRCEWLVVDIQSAKGLSIPESAVDQPISSITRTDSVESLDYWLSGLKLSESAPIKPTFPLSYSINTLIGLVIYPLDM